MMRFVLVWWLLLDSQAMPVLLPPAAGSSGAAQDELDGLTLTAFGSAHVIFSLGSTSACTKGVVADGRE